MFLPPSLRSLFMAMKSLFKKIKSLFRPLKNQRGIALLMVLSALAVMTIAVVEFVYNMRINYQLAVRNKERLQAYYLARSAVNLSKLVLKYNKEAEKLIKDNAAA